MFDELEEIWSLYADDGAQSLNASEEALQRLADMPGDAEAIGLLFRSLHTYKGNSRVLGLANIEACAHKAEDLIGLVRDEGVPMDSDIHSLLQEAVDVLRGMLETSSSARADVEPGAGGDLSDRIVAKIANCRGAGTAQDTGDAHQAAASPAESKPEDKPRKKRRKPEPTFDAAEDAEWAQMAHAPEPVAEMAPEPVSEPVSEAPEETVSAVIFDGPPSGGLADDPIYREIFAGMVHEVLAEMRQALDVFDGNPSAAQVVFRSEAERLLFAARQIGVLEWPEILETFLEQPSVTEEDANTLIAQMDALATRSLTAAPVVEVAGEVEEAHRFFVLLEPLLSAISSVGARITHGDAIDGEEIRRIAGELRALADDSGFVRLADIAGQLAASLEPQEFIAAELGLYEELALLEEAVPNAGVAGHISPIHALQSWCAERIFETLLELRNYFNHVKEHGAVCNACSRVILLMRQVYHTCHHYRLETAAHLTMSLTDLFIRVREGEMQPDPVLLHIARSFVGDMEAIFDTVSAGTTPDMSMIERLFDEATEVAFTASGAASSGVIETRLGLPKSFHKVLTPESCKDAAVALDAGKRFYILRADLNNDDDMAGRFLEWINTGSVKVISNVTVFQGNTTQFDFLLATDLDETKLNDALAVLDPSCNGLVIEAVLSDRRAATRKRVAVADPGGNAAISAAEAAAGVAEGAGGQTSAFLRVPADSIGRLMDLVGELSLTAQETIRSPDLAGLELEEFDKTAHRLKNIVREVQDATAELRMVPIGEVFRRLRRMVRELERQTGKKIELVLKGEETPIDKVVADRLYEPLVHVVRNSADHGLETLEGRRTAGKPDAGKITLSAEQEGTQVKIGVADDGRGLNRERILARAKERGLFDRDEEPEDNALWPVIFEPGFSTAEAVTNLSGRGVGMDVLNTTIRELRGNIAVESVSGQGAQVTLSIPVTLAFLDCLVMRHGNRLYAVPVDMVEDIFRPTAAQIIPVTADSVGEMVRLRNDLVPIRRLEDFYDEAAATKAPLNESVIVAFRTHAGLVGLPVDEMREQQQVVMKPLSGQLANIRAGIGCALLGTGEVALVLDCESLATRKAGRGD